jgi:DNA-binding phage protein
MKLSVIILNYNVRYFLEQCLLSVQKALKEIDGEIIVIDNMAQYAKERGWDHRNLYKVARGKAKSYKNLKLFNPLEQYRPSPDT